MPKKTTDPTPAAESVPAPDAAAIAAGPPAEAAPAPVLRKWKASARAMPELTVEAADEAAARLAYIAKLKLTRTATVTVTLAE